MVPLALTRTTTAGVPRYRTRPSSVCPGVTQRDSFEVSSRAGVAAAVPVAAAVVAAGAGAAAPIRKLSANVLSSSLLSSAGSEAAALSIDCDPGAAAPAGAAPAASLAPAVAGAAASLGCGCSAVWSGATNAVEFASLPFEELS